MFLTKWLLLAYTIEALMIRYIPAEWVAQALGGRHWNHHPGLIVGAPAYLNGYAAVPLVDALMTQGIHRRSPKFHDRRQGQLYSSRACGLGTGETTCFRRLF